MPVKYAACPVLAALLMLQLACQSASQTTPTPTAIVRIQQSSAAAPPPAATPAPTPPRLEKVRVGHSTGLGNILQVALARGYYEERGVEIERVNFGSSTEMIAPLSTGELDIGSVTPNVPFFNALGRGVDITLALDAGYILPDGRYVTWVTRSTADGPLVRDVAGLKGKRVGQNQRGVITEWALERLLAEAGLQLDDVEIVVMPFPEVLGGLGGGSVDTALLPEPFGTVAEERGLGTRLRQVDNLIGGGQVAATAFSERLVRTRPTVAQNFAVAYLRGAREAMDALELGQDREALIEILAQASGMDPRVVEKAGFSGVRRDGRVDQQSLGEMLDWLVQRGYLTQPPNLASLIDTQFADYAAGVLDGRR